MYRNGLRITGTPISKTDKNTIYYISFESLDFVLNTFHGISLANHDYQFFMAIDLMSTQEASYSS